MVNRRYLLGSAVAGGAMAATGWSALAQNANLPMRVGVSTSSEFVVIYYGVESGVFAKHGLDVKPISYASGVEMVTGLIAGAQRS